MTLHMDTFFFKQSLKFILIRMYLFSIMHEQAYLEQ